MRARSILFVGVVLFGLVTACSGNEETAPASDAGPTVPPENAGQSCKVAADCFVGLDGGAIHGEIQCLDRVTGGYCTHLCKTDADCCAVPGECRSGLRQVCSPFESTGQMMCLLACEKEDVATASDAGADAGDGGVDESTYCAAHASTAFDCRSSGGGSKNRKVCVP